jgi:hypothetical protein
VVMLAVTIVLFGTARALGPRGQRALLAVSGIALAALGIWQLVLSVLPLAMP